MEEAVVPVAKVRHAMKTRPRHLILISIFACLIGRIGSAVPLMESPRQPQGIALKTCRIIVPDSSPLREAIDELSRLLKERGASCLFPGLTVDGEELVGWEAR